MAATRSISDLPGPCGLPLIGNAHQVRPDEPAPDGRGVVRALRPGLPLRPRPAAGRRARRRRADQRGPARPPGRLPALERDPDDHRRDVGDGGGLRGRGRGLAPAAAAGGDGAQQQPPAALLRDRQHLHRAAARAGSSGRPRDGRSFEIGELLSSFTVDVTSALAFGHDLNTLERGDSELQGHLHRVFHMTNRRLFAPVPYWRWFKLPADRALDRSLAEIEPAVAAFMDEARRADRRAAGAARVAGELPRGDDRRPGKRRRLQRRGDPRQRLHPAARRRGHHLAHDGLDDLVAGLAAGDPGEVGRGGERGPRRAALRDRVRDGRGAPLRRGRAARVDAAEAGRADHRRRAARRHRGRRRPGPGRDPAAAPAPPRRPAGRRAGRRVPAGALARGGRASRRPTRSRSSPSAPARASAPAATSPSSRRRRRWR